MRSRDLVSKLFTIQRNYEYNPANLLISKLGYNIYSIKYRYFQLQITVKDYEWIQTSKC